MGPCRRPLAQYKRKDVAFGHTTNDGTKRSRIQQLFPLDEPSIVQITVLWSSSPWLCRHASCSSWTSCRHICSRALEQHPAEEDLSRHPGVLEAEPPLEQHPVEEDLPQDAPLASVEAEEDLSQDAPLKFVEVSTLEQQLADLDLSHDAFCPWSKFALSWPCCRQSCGLG